ncbi:MAG: tetratricopeptide repeat protein [Sulfuricella sp.]|nr:tetratricopeptide repeat protein [Sulfuricella sp.]
MSLLMEALKKAERAKQGQTVPHAEQSGQPGGAAETTNLVAAPGPGLSLLHQEGAAGHVDTTGASDFPSITATQETPSSIPDLSPMATPNIEPEPRPQPAASQVEVTNRAPPQDVRKIAAAQQKAKTVFSAKQPARSRTLLLTGTVAAVVLGLVGFGFYYWQITSTGTMVLPASTPQPTTAAAPAIPVDAGAPQQQGTPVASAQNPIDKPVLSPVEACPEPCRRGPAPVTVQASPPAASAAYDPARAEARSGSEPFKENPAIRIRQSAATSQLNPTLGKAYQSFLSGDTGAAQHLYQKVLQQEPNNRDALLGMAAIALKQKQAGQAAAYYGKLLDLDPDDPEALAALIGLQGQTDPTQSESRLKKVLLQNPQADAAHFALGNLYAQQSRWAEAQQSYFRAYSSAPGNANYAFNLAVSLDHLNQGKLALDYYQRALAQPGPANFDKSSVQTRITELLQPAGN